MAVGRTRDKGKDRRGIKAVFALSAGRQLHPGQRCLECALSRLGLSLKKVPLLQGGELSTL